MKKHVRYLALLVWLAASSVAWAKDPAALYLSWMHDPTTTMTIQWHAPKEEGATSSILYAQDNETTWHTLSSISHPLSRTSLLVHIAELTALKPDTFYRFKISSSQTEYRFRTLPSTLDHHPISFAVGGDAFFNLLKFRQMCRQIAKKDPDFVIIGGDIAYAEGHLNFFKLKSHIIKRWQTFFAEWKKEMVTSDGRLIPLVVVLGNHDIHLEKEPETPYFFQFFALPEQTQAYYDLNFGNYLHLTLLDTGHFSSIQGKQTEWLKQTLTSANDFLYSMAAYHVAAYPSYYPYNGSGPKKIRANWVPLFDENHLDVAFEHHNHTYKRTHPLKAGAIDPQGTLYLGDGSWGVPVRQPQSHWYLAKTAPINACWLATLYKEKGTLHSFGLNGQSIEEIRINR